MRECQSCGGESSTGVMCQMCIEYAWPDIVVGDGIHWIVRKAARRAIERNIGKNCYLGAYNAPYKVGYDFVPLTVADWLLSPLGALKEFTSGANDWGYPHSAKELFILTAIVRIKEVELRVGESASKKGYNLFLRGRSPSRVIEARNVHGFSLANRVVTPYIAHTWLDDQLKHERAIAAFEKKYRPRISQPPKLPPALPPPGTEERRECLSALHKHLAIHAPGIKGILLAIPEAKVFINGKPHFTNWLRWNEAMHLQRMVQDLSFRFALRKEANG